MTIEMQFFNESSVTVSRWSPYSSYDVILYDFIAGHKNIYVNNYSQNRGRAVDDVSLCLLCQDASTDMQYNLPRLFTRSGHLTMWMTEVKLLYWPFIVKMPVVRCVSTGWIRWCFAFLYIFLSSKVIRKKRWSYLKATFFFVWPALGRSKFDVK